MVTDLPAQQSFRPPRAGNGNVYLLGAGFSTDAGLPTIADFLNQMRDSTDWLAQQGRQAELTAVDAVLEFRHNAAAAGYRVNVDLDNIEDLFSLAAALPQQAASQNVQAAIGATLNYSQSRSRPPQVRMRVSAARGWPITPAWRAAASRVSPAPDSEDVECSAYDYYASVLAGRTSRTDKPNRNIVITFNYDLLLEEALDRLAIPFSYGLGTDNVTYDSTARSTTEPEEGSLLILKLHGSLNWGPREDNSITVFGTYDGAIAASGHPYLVPPTWEKTFSGPTRTVWQRALQALTHAARLIVVGFSFRPTDSHFKYLLAAGLMQKSGLRHIVVVDPRATQLLSQIQSVLRGDQFEYGVVQLQDKTLCEFLNSAQDLKSIARPLIHDGIDLVDLGDGYLERRIFLQA